VLQALALTCAIPYSTAIPVILGMNIGTSITPIISSISANTESKRVAFSCLYIKMVGVVVVSAIFYALNGAVGFSFMESNVYASAFNIAVVHTLFNIFSTVILLPFCSLLEKLAIMTVRGKKSEIDEENLFATLDDRFLRMPSFAVEKSKELVCEMANISVESFRIATGLLDDYSEELFAEVDKLESKVDKYEDKISTYLVKIAETNLAQKDSRVVTELLHCVGDIERISDHALNIAEAAKEINDKDITFSDKAKADIAIITKAVSEILDITVAALISDDLDAAKRVEPLEQVIDRLKRKIKNGHITRLREGNCTMELGFILSDLLTNYERVSDHCSNIAVCFIEMAHDSFSTHEYLSHVKSGEEKDFSDMYESYKQKYYME
jgi:phosphate:Na+ symporter